MVDLDHLLDPDVCEAAADAAQVPAFAQIQRRGLQRRRRRTALSAVVAVAALAVVLLVARNWVPGAGEAAPPVPAGPTPTTGTPARQDVVRAQPGQGEDSGPVLAWTDGGDTTIGAADIRRIEVTRSVGDGPAWVFTLAAPYPSEASLDAQRRVIEYGLVIDSNMDRIPDCEIGMNNDNHTESEPRNLRVWVKNLRSGVVEERIGGPYGKPVEFYHPYDGTREGTTPLARFLFLGGDSSPCDGSGDGDNIYAWTEVRDNGRVIARDVAPDTAWLRVQFTP